AKVDTLYGEDGDDSGSITQPTVSITDNTGNNAELISGAEKATICGNIGETDTATVDLVISDGSASTADIVLKSVTVNADGSFEVPNVDVSSLTDGKLEVTATFTDSDGNVATAKDDVVKDTDYGQVGNTGLPKVEITDNSGQPSGEELINSQEEADITVNFGAGVTSGSAQVVIQDIDGKTITLNISLSSDGSLIATGGDNTSYTVVNAVSGYYTIKDIDVSGLADGKLTANATFTDQDGNTAIAKPDDVHKDTVVSGEVDILSISPDNRINIAESQGSVVITGTAKQDAKPGDLIEFFLGDKFVGKGVVSEQAICQNGKQVGYAFAITVEGKNLVPDVLNGDTRSLDLTAKLHVEDAAGNKALSITTEVYFLDIVAPKAPEITKVTDDSPESDYSVVTLHGTGSEPGNEIEVFAKDANGIYVTIGTATVQQDLSWTLDISNESAIPLNDNEFLYAKEKDSFGNVSEASNTVHYYHGTYDPALAESTDDFVLLGSGDDLFKSDQDDANNKLVVDGGTGSDTAQFNFASTAAFVELNADGSVTITETNGDVNTFIEFENFTFTDGTLSRDQLLQPKIEILDTDGALSKADLAKDVSYKVTLPIGAIAGAILLITVEGNAQIPHTLTPQDINKGYLEFSYPGTGILDGEFNVSAKITLPNGQEGKEGTDSILVNTPPQAGDDTLVNVDEDAVVTISTSELKVNDKDVDKDTFDIVEVGGAVGGTVVLDGDNIIFRPNQDFNGQASFTYVVRDEHGDEDTATVVFVYDAVNDKATITGVTTGSVLEEDGNVVLTSTGKLAIKDVDGASEERFNPDNVLSAPGNKGSLAITADGNWTYHLDNSKIESLAVVNGQGQTLTETFTVYSVDGTPQQITVTVIGTNDKPFVSAQVTQQVYEDTVASINLLEHASDFDTGVVLSVTNVGSLPEGVTVSGNILSIDTNHEAYQHLGSQDSVPVTVTYQVSDEHGESVDQTVVITVVGTNDKPVAENFALLIDNGGEVQFTFNNPDLNLVTDDRAVSDVEDDYNDNSLKIVFESEPLFGEMYIAGTDQKVTTGTEVSADQKLEYRLNDNANDKLGFDAARYFGQHGQPNTNTLTIGGVTVSGGTYSGDITSSNVTLVEGSVVYEDVNKEYGFGVLTSGDTDSEISSGKSEYLSMKFADGVTVTEAEISFASLHEHYSEGDDENAQVNIYLYRDGVHFHTLVFDADTPEDTINASLGSQKIIFEQGFDEIRVTTTANANSNFTVSGLEVNSANISENIAYHAVDSEGEESNVAHITVEGQLSDLSPAVSVSIGEPSVSKHVDSLQHGDHRVYVSWSDSSSGYGSNRYEFGNESDHISTKYKAWDSSLGRWVSEYTDDGRGTGVMDDSGVALAGKGGSDRMDGTSYDDILVGGDGILGNSDGDLGEQIFAQGGDDILIGEGGDDALYGGRGTDTAVYAGNFVDYEISDVSITNDGGKNAFFTVKDINFAAAGRSDEGDDDLYDIEYLQFADGIYHWDGDSWENIEQTFIEYPLNITASVGDVQQDIIDSITISGLPDGAVVVDNNGVQYGSLQSNGEWLLPVAGNQTSVNMSELTVRIPEGERLAISVEVNARDVTSDDVESSSADVTAPHEVFVEQQVTPPTLISLMLDSSGSMDDFSYNGTTRMNLMLQASVSMLENVKSQPGSNEVYVQLVDFDDKKGESQESNIRSLGWFSVDQAIEILTNAQSGSVQIDGKSYFQVSGGTDYEEAAYATMNGYKNLPDGVTSSEPTNDVIYFISDGGSNGGWDGEVPAQWSDFTRGKDVTAVGIVRSVTSDSNIASLENISNKIIYIPDSELTTKLPQLAPTIGQAGDLLVPGSNSQVVIDADKLDVVQFIAADGTISEPYLSAAVVNGELKVDTIYGELYIQREGSYVFQPIENAPEVASGTAVGFEILYTVIDSNGVESQSLMSLNINAKGETMLASSHAQVGGSSDDILVGSAEQDILLGGEGSDTLVGGAGNDILTGGDDADIFKWVDADLDGSIDRITDFSLSEDKIDLTELLSNPTAESVSALLDSIQVSGDSSHSSMTITDSQNSRSVTIEFDGISATDLANNLASIIVVKDD
ncbi:VCBS domain-containing protein, partial [Vibrio vulnificus]